MNNKKWLTPPKVYFIWTLLYVVFLIIGVPLYSIGHSDGEQRPLSFIAYSIYFFSYGIILISFIVVPLFFKGWFKRHWLINILLGLFFLYATIKGGYIP